MSEAARTLRLRPGLAIVPGPPLRLWHSDSGQVEALSPAEVGPLLTAFVRPRPVADVLAGLEAGPANPDSASTVDLLERCVRAGLLVDGFDPAPTAVETLFAAPHRSLAEVLVDRPDVVVVGVPYDAGATSRPGSRFGPEALRRASGTCFVYREDAGHPTGAWDPVAERQVLAGVRMADVGDLSEVAPVRNGVVLDRLRQTVGHLAANGSVPVALGGDHSITLPVLTGLAKAHGPIGVIHVDAHADRGADPGVSWRVGVHHGNFLTWALRDQRITRLVQLGIRQREAVAPPPDPRVRVWPGTQAASVPLDEVLADLPEDLPWHVTLDVDALDPSVLPATGTPVPGGFGVHELAALLVGIAAQRRVVGVDVCELMPGSDETAGLIPCELLVRMLAAALAP